jgi:hypothetical protein
MMRQILLATSYGILFLLGAGHTSAEHLSLPVLKLCENANLNAPGISTAPIEPGVDPGTGKAQANPTRSVENIAALTERLQDLIENRLQQYVARPQDRTAVEAFYRGRDFAPLWVTCGRRPGKNFLT